MQKTHPDGMSIKLKNGQLVITREKPWKVISKYYDKELGAWVTRYQPAWATQDGFKDPL